ncbi:MAG: GNAT family N-acetyltransferase [Proteobacteria bacterium]|nr:GNAT family N-acetyltransferase [Desulfobacula sp.]MBU4132937.1 GNAT family N-acetyltransferase [Pseudomonadota bacterium]
MLEWKIEKIGTISPDFKIEIKRLWEKDPFSNPFASPSFIEILVEKVVAKGQMVIIARGYSDLSILSALWLLRLDKSRNLHFLQYYLCDYASPIYDSHTSVEDLSQGIADVIQTIQPRHILLEPLPEWGHTLCAARDGIKKAGYKYKAVPFGRVPHVRGATDSDGVIKFKKLFNRHRSLNNYTNQLKREKGFFFEINETGMHIDQWADQFCEAHDKRWEPTATPSKYKDKQPREDLKKALKAWAKDKVLIRFSICVVNRRITFVVGLKTGKEIIYFHTARLPVYNKLGTGNITIRLMGLWMADNGYNTMDFGRGNEAYKYYFANETQRIWRIYASRSVFSLYYLKGCIEEYIRKKESRIKIWEMIDKKILKSKLFKRF